MSSMLDAGTDRAARSALVMGALAVASALASVEVLPASAQQTPEGATAEMVREGRELFTGDGFCYACHGRNGRGVPDLGADLTDGEWTHTDGSFRDLVARIRKGVPAEESASGVPMPPAGGADLTADQIRAVAAYVWSLSRGG